MGLRQCATDQAQLRCGANGYDYVFSRRREAVAAVAAAIGRRSGIYYWPKYGVRALRIRRARDKTAVRRLFGLTLHQVGLFTKPGEGGEA